MGGYFLLDDDTVDNCIAEALAQIPAGDRTVEEVKEKVNDLFIEIWEQSLGEFQPYLEEFIEGRLEEEGEDDDEDPPYIFG